MVLGAGLEPACLSAYAPQTYVSAIPPPERRDGEFSADESGWQVSSDFSLLVLMLSGLIAIEIGTTAVKVFEHE